MLLGPGCYLYGDVAGAARQFLGTKDRAQLPSLFETGREEVEGCWKSDKR